ncbi:uncharacterized protein LOC113061401 [Carassius auratus]|uniref:Uncharacterized protein LOC113061401 n=1 Tax=Carassius auratus TaxID=7957 RepID=A0A6P6LNY4_CARAU|nr:uncharacterized protein LOC113061401 [Carassius auratus]
MWWAEQVPAFVPVCFVVDCTIAGESLPKCRRSYFSKVEAVMAAVRDMYEGVDVENMTPAEQKRHRETQLNQHPNILFRINRKDRLHVLLFRPTGDSWWINIIKENYGGIFAQWTFQHADNQPIRHAMNLSGNRDELQRFCDEFPDNLEAFRAHVQENEDQRDQRETIEDLRETIEEQKETIEEQRETIEDDNAAIQDLEERIRELDLENRRLRRQHLNHERPCFPQ